MFTIFIDNKRFLKKINNKLIIFNITRDGIV